MYGTHSIVGAQGGQSPSCTHEVIEHLHCAGREMEALGDEVIQLGGPAELRRPRIPSLCLSIHSIIPVARLSVAPRLGQSLWLRNLEKVLR